MTKGCRDTVTDGTMVDGASTDAPVLGVPRVARTLSIGIFFATGITSIWTAAVPDVVAPADVAAAAPVAVDVAPEGPAMSSVLGICQSALSTSISDILV